MSDPDDGPAEDVRGALSALVEGRPDQLWESLPEGYRADLSTLVHGVVAATPAESWDRTASLLKRTAAVARDHEDWLLSHSVFEEGAWPVTVDPEATAGFLEQLVASPLGSHATATDVDVGVFLRTTGRELAPRGIQLLGHTFAEALRTSSTDLKAVEVTTLSVDANRAVVRISSKLDEGEHDFVRVEQRWIPVALVDGWEDWTLAAGRAIDTWRSDEAAHARLSAALDEWDRMLTALESAEDETAFHDRITEWASALRSTEPEPVEPTPVPADGVTVVFTGRLDLATVDAVQVTLNAAAADPDLAVSIDEVVGEETRFTVSHAGDVTAFAERLGRSERVEVVEVDEEAVRIRATWTTP